MRLFTAVAALRCYLDLCRFQQIQRRTEKFRADSPEAVADTTSVRPTSVGARQYAPLVGFVPTMGALHAGHLSLIHRARQENDLVVVSIFVNPLQFGPTEDLQQYPRTLEQDRQLCEQAGVDAIFAPTAKELYGSKAQGGSQPREFDATRLTQVIPPENMVAGLCGRSRPGHFQGVVTVVAKLLNLVQPDRAYFGRKDAQQLAIIHQLVQDLNLPVEIVACPIIRESNGLAYSSRNQYLTPEQKDQAAVLYRSLQRAEQVFRAGEHFSTDLIDEVKAELVTAPTVQLEYVELVHPMTLQPLDQIQDAGLLAIAARIGTTRLIDNIVLRNRRPVVAIDGPAGAGKSTVTRQVAKTLGLLYLDTGAMYRAVTWLVLQSGLAIDDEPAIAELVSQCDIQLAASEDPQAVSRVWINNDDVTQAIRSREVTSQVSAIAAQPAVRQQLVKQQQRYGQKGGLVAEGRDIGTHVFPDAELKIFLTASVQERARRRQQDLKNQNQPEISLEQLERDIYERDWKDSTREISPLQKAIDAIEIQTDGLSIAEVTARIVELYHQKLSTPAIS